MANDPKSPVIIKLHPKPEEYLEAEIKFFYTLGTCVNRWAFLDRQLYRLCRFALRSDARQTAFFYYSQRAFNHRLQYVSDALKTVLPLERFENEWRPLHNKIVGLARTRNIFAHHPAKRLGTSDGEKAVYIYSIHIEPYERVLNRDYQGLRGKKELLLTDLEEHAIAVDNLEGELRAFHRKLIAPAQGASRRLRPIQAGT